MAKAKPQSPPRFIYESIWPKMRKARFDTDHIATVVHLLTGPNHVNKCGLFCYEFDIAAAYLGIAPEKMQAVQEKIFDTFTSWSYDHCHNLLFIRDWFEHYPCKSNSILLNCLRQSLCSEIDAGSPLLREWAKNEKHFTHRKERDGKGGFKSRIEVFREFVAENAERFGNPSKRKPKTKKRVESKIYSESIECIYQCGQKIFLANGFRAPKNAAAVAVQKDAIRLMLECDSETDTTIGQMLEFLKHDLCESNKPGGWRGWGRACGSFATLRDKMDKIRPQAISQSPSIADQKFGD